VGSHRRRGRDQGGQAAPEYLGVLVLVAAIVAAASTTGLGSAIGDGIRTVICRIVPAVSCPTSSAAGPAPPRPTSSTKERDAFGVELELAYERLGNHLYDTDVDILAAAVYEDFNPGDGPTYVDGTDFSTNLNLHPEDAGWGPLPMDGKGDTYDGRYYAPAALEKIVLASSENMAELERRALARALKAGIEPGDPQFDQWWDATSRGPPASPRT